MVLDAADEGDDDDDDDDDEMEPLGVETGLGVGFLLVGFFEFASSSSSEATMTGLRIVEEGAFFSVAESATNFLNQDIGKAAKKKAFRIFYFIYFVLFYFIFFL